MSVTGRGLLVGCGTRSSFGRPRKGPHVDRHLRRPRRARRQPAQVGRRRTRPGRWCAPPRTTRLRRSTEIWTALARWGCADDRPARVGRRRWRVGARRRGRARGVRPRAGPRAAARARPSPRRCSASRRSRGELAGGSVVGLVLGDVVWDAPSATHLLAAPTATAGAWCRGLRPRSTSALGLDLTRRFGRLREVDRSSAVAGRRTDRRARPADGDHAGRGRGVRGRRGGASRRRSSTPACASSSARRSGSSRRSSTCAPRCWRRPSRSTAAAWDVASVAFTDDEQWAYAADVAGAVALDGAVRNAQACIQVLGGIGFTFEHDAHLYLRRATGLRSLLGSPDGFAGVAGRAGHGGGTPAGRGRPRRPGRRRARRRTSVGRGDRGDAGRPAAGRPGGGRLPDAALAAPHGLAADAVTQLVDRPGAGSGRRGATRPQDRRLGRADDPRARERRAAGAVRAADAARRADLVPAVQRARSGLGPRVAAHPRDEGRGRLAAHRPEGVDVARTRGRLGDLPGPNRPGRAAAQGDLLLPASTCRPRASTSGRCAS